MQLEAVTATRRANFLRDNIDVNGKEHGEGRTALHIASEYGHAKFAGILLGNIPPQSTARLLCKRSVSKRNAGALSGGIRRRLSIAMALLGSPAVVILDEPATG
jgi:ATPase subunit of ABC transporter with duplicated ATPase domains